MGEQLVYFARGVFGHIFTSKYSHLLVNQIGDEKDGHSQLVAEYHIADFLGTKLLDFVAAPFALMCCVSTSRNYDEKLSLLQQRIHGKTFDDIKPGEFTKNELWSMFLQCNEFILRLGDVVSIHDVRCENVMVEVRVTGAQSVYRFWFLAGGTPI